MARDAAGLHGAPPPKPKIGSIGPGGAPIRDVDLDGDKEPRQKLLNGQLMLAASWGKTAEVMRLLNEGAEVNAVDEYGSSALHNSIDAKTMKVLLNAGAAINMPNVWDSTPLHHVAATGRADCVRLLVERGAVANARNKLGVSPLHNAGNAEVARTLIAGGAVVNVRDANGATPLHSTVRGDIAKTLLQNGADVNVPDYTGGTPMHMAAYKGRMEAAEQFIEYDTNLDTKNFVGWHGYKKTCLTTPLRLRGARCLPVKA